MTERPNDLSTQLALERTDTSAILVLAPSLSTCADRTCMDLLTVADPQTEDVLLVATTSPTAKVDTWRSYVGQTPPANIGIVTVDEQFPSATDIHSELDQSPVIETIADPGDLTGIGIALTTYFSDHTTTDYQTVVCFQSLTTLLQYADLQRVFKFLHTVMGRLQTSGAIAHFHCDPSAHDEQTINTLKQLFDTIVRIDEQENRTVTTLES